MAAHEVQTINLCGIVGILVGVIVYFNRGSAMWPCAADSLPDVLNATDDGLTSLKRKRIAESLMSGNNWRPGATIKVNYETRNPQTFE